jgi:choline dehydrogenase-like flavoprotein
MLCCACVGEHAIHTSQRVLTHTHIQHPRTYTYIGLRILYVINVLAEGVGETAGDMHVSISKNDEIDVACIVRTHTHTHVQLMLMGVHAHAHQIGVPANPDYNGEYQEGASHLQTTTSPHSERWSASSAYIWPHIHKRKNLEVVTNANVARVLVECLPSKSKGKGKGTGGSVGQEECVTTATGVVLSVGGREKVILAQKQVIVTASAVFTPKVLMLSGTQK